MSVFLVTLHIMACVILIVVVLLQHGKGADMGAVLGGGGGNTVFGGRGAGNFLTKLTTGCAVLFMVTSLTLSYVYSQESDNQLFEAGYEESVAPGSEESLPGDGLTETPVGEETVSPNALEEVSPDAEATAPAAGETSDEGNPGEAPE